WRSNCWRRYSLVGANVNPRTALSATWGLGLEASLPLHPFRRSPSRTGHTGSAATTAAPSVTPSLPVRSSSSSALNWRISKCYVLYLRPEATSHLYQRSRLTEDSHANEPYPQNPQGTLGGRQDRAGRGNRYQSGPDLDSGRYRHHGLAAVSLLRHPAHQGAAVRDLRGPQHPADRLPQSGRPPVPADHGGPVWRNLFPARQRHLPLLPP